ncbi:MAG: thioredoxin family protein [Actinomycetota bacterium]|nr:thioredoxin family protein [Actinomycetota bacterium]
MPRLRQLMAEAQVDAPVELKHVRSIEDAEHERFLGSPTLRIDGRDVDPGAARRDDFGLKCRLYATGCGLRGEIPDELITAGLTRGRHADADG